MTILREAWWVIGILVVLKIGVGIFLYRSRRTIRILKTDVRKMREGSNRLLQTLYRSRDNVAHLEQEQALLKRKLYALTRAVILLPLPSDLRSCYENDVIHLPRISYEGDGRVAVMIPGIYKRYYGLHGDPKQQANEDRECIYEALRNSKEARAELGLDIS